MTDSDPIALFTYLIKKLDEKNLGFVEVNELQGFSIVPYEIDSRYHDGQIRESLKKHFRGVWVVNGGMTLEKANDLIKKGQADMVSFAELYACNPDLV